MNDGAGGTSEVKDDDFDVRLEIETPERIRVVHELAGIGSRFAAGTIDMTILFLIWTVVSVLILTVGSELAASLDLHGGAAAMAAIGVFYVVLWAYFLGFELFWNGQTPGKWMLDLRVVSDAGGPASASAIFVRNLLRVADVLPLVVAHVLGGMVMFLNARAKRIGDLAAGTVVVRERSLDLDVARIASSAETDAPRRPDDLDDEERRTVARFMDRAPELMPLPRADLARRLVEALGERRALPDIEHETLLQLLDEGHAPADLRDRTGPSLSPAAAREAPSP
jgi:uncharacterized RDD family membrane protein YckC